MIKSKAWKQGYRVGSALSNFEAANDGRNPYPYLSPEWGEWADGATAGTLAKMGKEGKGR